jgi:manganese/zinc/iron transport system ATP- binding protein
VEYFDWIILMNMRLVACGPKDKVFTRELLQETYGGRLNVLTKISDLIEQQNFPARE